MSKLLTVFGATGQQGGSVIKTFQFSPSLSATWKLRAVTRDINSSNSTSLTSTGVQVVSADFTKPDTLAKAVEGSYAAFVTTLSTPDAQEEVRNAKSIVDACLAANVKHLIWSGVPSPKKVTNGKLSNVVLFDSKYEVTEYIESIKGDKMIASYFEPAGFFSNFQHMLTPDDQGIRTLALPYGDGDQLRLPFIDTDNDTGVYVAALLSTDSKVVNGLRAQAVTQWMTGNEIARTLTEVTGKPFKYENVSPDQYAQAMPEFLRLRYKEMGEFIRDYHYYGVGSESKQAGIDATLGITQKSSLANWAKGNKAVQSIR